MDDETARARRVRNETENLKRAHEGLANAEILAKLRRDLLTPQVLERTILKALNRYQAQAETSSTSEARLRETLARLDRECARLAGVLASGDALPSVVDLLRARERERIERRAELALVQARQPGRRRLEPEALRAEIGHWLTAWHGLLEGDPAGARRLLRALLVSRLVWTPGHGADGVTYRYAARVSYGRLLAGVVGVKEMVPPG